MKTNWSNAATVAAVTFLVLMTLYGTAQAVCAPTPGVAATEDVEYGECLFSNRTAFGQNPLTPFPKCASCHYSGTAFQDKAVHFNVLKNILRRTLEVQRNTPTLFNAGETAPYGWDGRNRTLEAQIREAILNPQEMNGTGVTQEQLDALAAFVKSIKPPESPYDLFVAGDPTALSDEAVMGMDIFFGRGTCVICHTPPLFTNNTLLKNQINATLGSKSDTGALFALTGPRLFFSVPQLRGVRLTAPYMHNGALGTLEQVVRFYSKSFGLNLTNQEVHYLVEFLRAL